MILYLYNSHNNIFENMDVNKEGNFGISKLFIIIPFV